MAIIKRKQKKKLKLTEKVKVIIIVATAVVLVGGGVGGWYLWQRGGEVDTQKGGESKYISEAEISNTETDFEKGKTELLGRLEDNATDERKSEIKTALAGLALNTGQNEEALQYSLEADELNPTQYTARMVAYVAEFMGDNEKAISYYNIAIERAEESVSESTRRTGPHQNFVKEMRSGIEELQR